MTNGAETVRYTYDAWGNITSVQDGLGNDVSTDATHPANANPLRYRSYYYDAETGFYYLNSRYYDPVTGRFLSADTTNLLSVSPDVPNWHKNLFAYCDNNPQARADNGGEVWHIVVGGLIGGLISGGIKLVSNIVQGKNLWDGVITASLSGAASGALAMTGAGIGTMILGNSGIAMMENASNQLIKNGGFENFDIGDMVYDGIVGGVSGAIGGPGKGTNHLMSLGTQSIKRTYNAASKGIGHTLKTAAKAASYYIKNTKYFYKPWLKEELIYNPLCGVGEEIVTSDLFKDRFNIFSR